MHHDMRITLDVRGEHSFRYEWTELVEPHRRGLIDGTWSEAGSWAKLAPSDGSPAKLLRPFGPLVVSADGVASTTAGTGQWFLPLVDAATGKLGDELAVAHVPPKIPPTVIRQRVSPESR